MKHPKRELQTKLDKNYAEIFKLLDEALKEGYIIKRTVTIAYNHQAGIARKSTLLLEAADYFNPAAAYQLFTFVEPR